MKAVAYARVSTLLKQDPEHQLVPIRGLATGRGFQLVDEYVDRVSGTTERRKELDRLVRDARLGKFKVVIIYALDRLARDTRFLLNLLHELDSYGVTIISMRESIDLSTPIGKAVLQILGSIAELERNLISERIRTALAVKKMSAHKTGWRCGRKPIASNVTERIVYLRDRGLSIREVAKIAGVGKTTVERVIKATKNDVPKS